MASTPGRRDPIAEPRSPLEARGASEAILDGGRRLERRPGAAATRIAELVEETERPLQESGEEAP